jgi:hypothetical protein
MLHLGHQEKPAFHDADETVIEMEPTAYGKQHDALAWPLWRVPNVPMMLRHDI